MSQSILSWLIVEMMLLHFILPRPLFEGLSDEMLKITTNERAKCNIRTTDKHMFILVYAQINYPTANKAYNGKT